MTWTMSGGNWTWHIRNNILTLIFGMGKISMHDLRKYMTSMYIETHPKLGALYTGVTRILVWQEDGEIVSTEENNGKKAIVCTTGVDRGCKHTK